VFVQLRGRSELVADAWSGCEVRSANSWQADANAQRQTIRNNERNSSVPAAAFVSVARE